MIASRGVQGGLGSDRDARPHRDESDFDKDRIPESLTKTAFNPEYAGTRMARSAPSCECARESAERRCCPPTCPKRLRRIEHAVMPRLTIRGCEEASIEGADVSTHRPLRKLSQRCGSSARTLIRTRAARQCGVSRTVSPARQKRLKAPPSLPDMPLLLFQLHPTHN